MSEREVIKSLLDFAFIIKAQLHSEEATLLKSILAITIMESEDLLELLDEKSRAGADTRRRGARR